MKILSAPDLIDLEEGQAEIFAAIGLTYVTAGKRVAL